MLKDGVFSEINSVTAGLVCEEPEMDFEEYEAEYYDSVTGAMLETKMVAMMVSMWGQRWVCLMVPP